MPETTDAARIKMYADALRSNVRELEKMGCKIEVTRTGYIRRVDGQAEAFFEHKAYITKEETF